MKITVFMATSLDGFIADENGGVDWLNEVSQNADPEEDYGYQDLIAKVDALVMGRNTFDTVLSFEGPWPYGDLPVRVISSREAPATLPAGANISFLGGTPESLIDQLTEKGIQHIYLDGGTLIRSFLDAGYISEFILTQVPAMLGKGIPLFHDPLPSDQWEDAEVKTYSNGFTQTHLKKKEPANS